ncbi:PPE domain-containing protein [Nocardia transvalensis]|uniref:PPE domain-containing protein n=1 Tax=Nocardia transvalensis TaxID=37333 RepID=UPI001893A03D|nr:PPE domain-containing protein [Nocardia transvalensis]MBF6327522.1 PPE domain-containing protein [Nocardia transvalensis]
MVEPPVPGFTGVVWEARPTEQLARDLTTGPGAVPMAEAAAAWTQLAASFGAAVIEYDRIINTVREAWRSEGSEMVLERITKLREWLMDAATAAGRNAAHAGGQATAHEVARMAMPHVAEIAALEAAKQAIEQVGAGLGAPLVGAAAQVDAQQDLAKAGAARVMRSYESAAAPLATPWEQQPPPVIASAAALEAEQVSATAPPSPAVAPAVASGAFPAALAGRLGAVEMPRVPSAYRTQTVQVVPEAQASPLPSTSTSTESSTGRGMVPGSVAPSTALSDAERTVRAAAAADRPGEGLEIEAGIAAAPPVLGGAEQPRTTAPGQAS